MNLINFLKILSVWVSANITLKFIKIMILSNVLMKTKCVFACLRLILSLLELALCVTPWLPAGGSAVGNRIVSCKFFSVYSSQSPNISSRPTVDLFHIQ